MKRSKKDNKTNLNEWLMVAAPLALEVGYEVYMAKGRSGLSEKTPEEVWGLFSRKYADEIADAQNIFLNIMKENTLAMDSEFFSEQGARRIVYSSIEENRVKINAGNGKLSTLIFENSTRYAKGGLSDKNKLTTSQVIFSWNGKSSRYDYPKPEDKYFERKSEIAASNYWILDGYENLGDVQFPGDPFTYEESEGGNLIVISAPEIYKKSIGKIFPDPRIKALELADENTAAEESVVEQDAAATAGKSLIPPELYDLDKETVDTSYADALEQVDETSKQDIISKLENYAASSQTIPAYSWLMASKVGPRPIATKIFRQINKKIGNTITAECRSRRAMIMLAVAGYIVKSGVESSRAVQALKDPISDMLEIKMPGRKSKQFKDAISGEIEKVCLEMRDFLVERFGPIAATDPGGLDDPEGILDDMFGGTDKCGKSLSNPDGTQTGRRRYDHKVPKSPSPVADYDTTVGGRTLGVKMGALN